MKSLERNVFAPLAHRLDDARLHLPRGFVGKRQAQDVFPGQRSVRLQQVADALRDDARFSSAGAGDHQQWPFAVRDRASLRLIQLQSGIDRRIQIEQRRHDSRREEDLTTKWKYPGMKKWV